MTSDALCFENVDREWLQKAVLIRETEMMFLRLFAEGRLHGTVHTCVGQEFSALAFAGQLASGDFIFSNHRGHGHYLAFTGDVDGLVAELMGRAGGVCGGIGSSQHLCAPGFFTNGIQGGIVPCATGHALAAKLRNAASAGLVFIGDGTLGEGVVYESMNLMALLQVPLLVVCEDNGVAQSTPQEAALAGGVLQRAEAFGLRTWSGDTDEPARLMDQARQAIQWVREAASPGFFHVRVARLNAHSKGDDERPKQWVESLWSKDFLRRFSVEHPQQHERLQQQVQHQVQSAVTKADKDSPLPLSSYAGPPAKPRTTTWAAWQAPTTDVRMVTRLQEAWTELMAEIPGLVMIGEDILSPYGGAFKVTKGLSDKFPGRVISTPISEAGITGLANGLALAGMKPVVEIMFGDFITLALDQLLNHAAKFHHMYHRKAACPMVLRTPMGGGRGYGPTHSQSLEKLVAGIDTLTTVALNCLIDPAAVVRAVMQSAHPVVIIENKLDYGRRLGMLEIPGYVAEQSASPFPALRLRPRGASPQVTLVAYGGLATDAVEAVRDLFAVHEILAELVILTQIGPMDAAPVIESARSTRMLVTIEEGTAACGIGGELIARTAEAAGPLRALRIAAQPFPIPSPKALEAQVLPCKQLIVEQVASFFRS